MGMGILDGKVAIVTGASRGIGAEIARRFGAAGAAVAVAARTTGAGTSPFPGTIGETAELYDDKIAVNALSPSQVVPTPGTIFHHLTTEDDANSEPPAVMAEAALLLCSAEPKALTGRITYSQDLLAELGVSVPARR